MYMFLRSDRMVIFFRIDQLRSFNSTDSLNGPFKVCVNDRASPRLRSDTRVAIDTHSRTVVHQT